MAWKRTAVSGLTSLGAGALFAAGRKRLRRRLAATRDRAASPEPTGHFHAPSAPAVAPPEEPLAPTAAPVDDPAAAIDAARERLRRAAERGERASDAPSEEA